MAINENNQKSETITVILSLILGLCGLNGIGHIYAGQTKKGIIICIASIIIYLVMIFVVFFGSILSISSGNIGTGIGTGIGGYIAIVILYIAIFIWQIFDSLKACRKYNRGLH